MSEGTTHAFIVRVWLEEEATETRDAVWRGHVTHVPTEARVAVKTLDEICVIIQRFLKTMDMRPNGHGYGEA